MINAALGLHIALELGPSPTIAQLKRYTFDPSKPVELRRVAMMEVTLRTSRKVTWLREVIADRSSPQELKESAREYIAGVKVLRMGRAALRRHGLW